MKPEYDIVFVTHLPAFYKVNLYQALAQRCNIYVIFLGQASTIRAKDFVPSELPFEHCILDNAPFEGRHTLKNIWRLKKQLKQLKYKRLVLGGWDLLEFWYLLYVSPKEKNSLALESSALESSSDGIRGLIKRQFLSRITSVFASGTPHQQLLTNLQFTGKVYQTLGVGIFNYFEITARARPEFSGKFLTVARLAPEKNLQRLIEAFRNLPQFQLTLVGDGPLKAELQLIKPANVEILGHVPNDTLAQLYQQQDVFVLPSLAEPWGLVVEEALYYGLPVLAANRVGCAIDLVQNKRVGCLFDPENIADICDALLTAQLEYHQWQQNVKQIDFRARDEQQVKQYLESIS